MDFNHIIELREKIEELSGYLDDTEIVEFPELAPKWSGQAHIYEVGNRVRYNNNIYKCVEDHTSQENNPPENIDELNETTSNLIFMPKGSEEDDSDNVVEEKKGGLTKVSEPKLSQISPFWERL